MAGCATAWPGVSGLQDVYCTDVMTSGGLPCNATSESNAKLNVFGSATDKTLLVMVVDTSIAPVDRVPLGSRHGVVAAVVERAIRVMVAHRLAYGRADALDATLMRGVKARERIERDGVFN